ncbi:DUF1631 family protein [Luteimonas aestuarii]|uniref:DUF1631 family protein n=1 Tax=Luteimonas aestuarii TaxID=453837 RepID=UPI001404A5BD|nr:DUF1631 family protein [Luteimonas aestuarii]
MQDPGQAGGRVPPADILDNLRNGLVARLMPLMRDSLDAALRELDGRAAASPPSPALVEDRTDIGMLLREVLAYEKRWQEQIDTMLRGWPALSRARTGKFELMAESELHVQLVGAPVIDALERRFGDMVDLLDRRLYTVAARMGSRERPRNPFGPSALAETFLRAFTVLDSSARVHALVLKHFARLASERLGAIYHWCNGTLAEAGYEMSSGNEGVLVLGLAPELAQARVATGRDDRGQLDRLRRALVGMARAQPAGTREMLDGELLAALDLLGADRAATGQDESALGEQLRLRIDRVAASIGLAPGEVVRSPLQEAAIEITSRLFEHLRDHAVLSDVAARTLSRLAVPCTRCAMEVPGLFDDAGRPPLLLLSTLVELWDGNAGRNPAEAVLHRIADQAAADVLADLHGGLALAPRLLEHIESEVGPIRRRADMAARRLWQSMQGKERLDAARAAADRQLEALFERGPLPPVLAAFLSEHWRQWLAQTWLRDGAGSDRYIDATALGERLLAIDGERDGRRVAQSLLEVEPTLRECVASSGLQGEASVAALSALVAEFADPDRRRQPAEVEPLAKAGAMPAVEMPSGAEELQAGDRVLHRLMDGGHQALHVAWRSPLTGRCLLVDAQGARVADIDAVTLEASVARGDLIVRQGDPVRNALSAIASAIAAHVPAERSPA